MNRELIITFNKIAGTFLLIVALVFPVMNKKFFVGATLTVAEQKVARIARVERNQQNSKYILFKPNEMPKTMQDETGVDLNKEQDFIYDAFLEADGTLVVRARLGTKVVEAAGISPTATYLYRVHENESEDGGKWVAQAG